MTNSQNAFSASYLQWVEAQEQVSQCERTIFRDGHQLTAEDLSSLQALRATAMERLRKLIDEFDFELASLHPQMGPPMSAEQLRPPAG